MILTAKDAWLYHMPIYIEAHGRMLREERYRGDLLDEVGWLPLTVEEYRAVAAQEQRCRLAVRSLRELRERLVARHAGRG